MVLPKAQVRTEFLAARRMTTPQTRRVEADLLADHVARFVEAGQTVCAYAPVGSEPGSLNLLATLLRSDVVVLLPIARHTLAGTPLPLRWAHYHEGGLIDAPFGLREPAPPWLPADTVAEAATVLVPALAVDRAGVRLGRGAGFYDRTLHLADPNTALVAVVRDDELVDQLPSEPHDVPMTHALTPHEGLVGLNS